MKRLLLVVALLLVLIAVAACGNGGQEPAGPEQPADGGEAAAAGEYQDAINIAMDVDPETFNPLIWKNTTAYRLGHLIYKGLVYIDDSLAPQPALAESWENPDEMTWVFHLRQGVTFHDGSDFTSADVKYTFEQLLNEANNAPYRSRFTAIASIDTPDDYTIQFNLSKPNAALLVYLDMGIIPEGAMDDPEFATHPIGTGPYKVAKYELNNVVTLEAYENYYEGVAVTKTINCYIINDNSVRLAALESGDVDFVCSPLTASDLQLVEGKQGLVMNKVAGLGITYLGFNVTDPVIGDLEVRKAIAQMVDKNTISSVIYSDMDTPGATPLQYHSWAWDESLKDYGYAYDVEAAKATLEAAGWVDSDGDGIREKDGVKLAFTLATHTDDTSRFQVVEYLQNNLKGIGMDVSVSVTEWATFSDDMMNKRCQVWVAGWLNLYDPDRMYDMFHSTSASNYGGYSDPTVDAKLDEGRGTSDLQVRAADYQYVAKFVTDEVYYVTLLDQAYVSIHTDKLEGYAVYPSGAIYSLWQARVAK